MISELESYLSLYVRRKESFPDHAHASPLRARRLLDRLGAPDGRMPIVRVIGTKGKGSTAAMLEAVLRAAGYRTGLYTSPHLHTPRERIRVDGLPIGRDEFLSGLRFVLPELEASLAWEIGPLTLFEGLTALAMRHFAQQGVELAVVEAGMGGRSDATHALRPVLTVLTPISLDHQAYLGDTVVEIAAEKAGAVPEGGMVACARQEPDAWEVVLRHCRAVGATVHTIPEELATVPGLAGPHQRENARLVVLAVTLLRSHGWHIPEDAVREGLRDVQWPGRLEIVAGRPLTVVDGAHNPAAAKALASALVEEGFVKRQPCILVLGASADKDLLGLIRPLVPLADQVVTTRAAHHRAVDEQVLAALVERQGVPARPANPVAEALRIARERAGPEGLVCVTGSFFVVAEAREALGLAVREPWPEPVPSGTYDLPGDTGRAIMRGDSRAGGP